MFKEFSVSPRSQWSASSPWGGGHTTETDPTRKGWRLVASSHQLAVIGQKGVKGCASVMPLSDGRLDVAYHDEAKPEELAARFSKNERVGGDGYLPVDGIPGWGLLVIEEIERIRRG